MICNRLAVPAQDHLAVRAVTAVQHLGGVERCRAEVRGMRPILALAPRGGMPVDFAVLSREAERPPAM
ncbi:hypothetical protein STENM223S_06584 [Streptomyces tendae]